MYAGRTYLERYSTPDDEIRPGQIEDLLFSLFVRNRGPILLSAYNFSLPQVWEGLDLVRKQGHVIGGVLDRSQFAGPSCQQHALPDIEANPGWWANQWLAVGSTQFGAIEHKKVIIFNAPVCGYSVPDGDFESLDDVMSAGYPLVWDGSFNFSIPAVKQANTIELIPGKIVAAETARTIVAQRDLILAKHQAWQPVPLPAGGHAGTIAL